MKKTITTISIFLMFVIYAIGQQSNAVIVKYTGDAKGAINVPQDKILAVQLPEKPANGYTWVLINKNEDILKRDIQLHFTPYTQGLASEGINEIRFMPKKGGETVLRFELKRPWENEKALDAVEYTVIAEGAYNGELKFNETLYQAPVLKKSDYEVKALPASYSLLQLGYMTVVKDQGSCGSCWAFATCGVFESEIKRADGVTRDLSEQWLINCGGQFGHMGCQGAYGAPYEMLYGGAVYEQDEPYKAADGTCKTYPRHEKITSWSELSESITVLKQAIYDHGAVWCAVASSGMNSYTGGVWQGNGSTQRDHAVVLVGWDDNNQCWIMRNSWGTSWGENSGYMRIKYGANAIGGVGASLVYTGSGPVDPEYCTAQSGDASSEWISKVELNGQSKTSTGSQYSDFTATTINLVKGANNVTLTPGFAGTTYNEAWKIWIDFNGDLDFDDAGEELFSKSGSAAVSGTITIPTSATGKTRMRIAMRYNAAPTPCGSFDYGEVEDYTVSFGSVDTEAPSVPTNLVASNVAMTSLSLSWTASTDNVGVDHYTVLINGAVAGNTNTTTYNATGLTAGTVYNLTVKAFDAAGNVSPESNVLRVATIESDNEAPTVPTNLASSNITDKSVSLNWTASTDNVGVDHYTVLKNGTVIGNSNTTTYNVTGLTAATDYIFTVKAVDAAANESRESSELRIATLPAPVGKYCTAQGDDASAEWISKVDVAGQSKTSQSAKYSDFTATVFNLAIGSNSVTLTPGFSGTKYNESWKIWIDFNKDYDFDDAGEELFAKSGTTAVNGTITIPASASGQTRMRIAMRYNTASAPCGNFNYGEVEDYTVNFGVAPVDTEAPTVPQNLRALVNGSSVTLTWDASSDNVGVVNYVVCEQAACIASPITTSYTINNLADGTYSYTVKAMDAAGNTSDASIAVPVTIGGNPNPTYCDSKGEESSYFWISKVALTNMSNVSGNDNGYADYTSKVATIAKGATVNIALQTGYQDYEYTVNWALWIDYNQNGLFESSELVEHGATATSSEVQGTFTVPASALTGNTRLRISMNYDGEATPCETFTYGEVEDYTVNISASSLGDTYTEVNTGAEELGFVQKSDIRLYPSPVDQMLNIELFASPKSDINIISVTGAFIRTIKVTSNVMQINVSDLAPGMYLLQYNNGLRNKLERFIKE